MKYGVTKISVKGYYPKGALQGNSLIFYNDISLQKVLQSEEIIKLETQLIGEGNQHAASLFLQMKREGAAMPKYNVFAGIANRV